MKNLRAELLGELQHVVSAAHDGGQRTHGIGLIVDRRGRTGQIIGLVYIGHNGPYVVVHVWKTPFAPQLANIVDGASLEAVDA
jgi:hypothetical protein